MASFVEVIKWLREFYGRPQPPRVTHPYEMILYETVAYLRDDVQRDAAFAALKKCVGFAPEKILAADNRTLVEICRIGGIVPEIRGPRLRKIAGLMQRRFKGNLRSTLKKPLPKAKKELMRFPAIGEPGAEKILLFNRAYPVLALDSNGLRVLQRLGFAPESRNYSAAYRATQKAVQDQLPKSCGKLIEAHQLLRRHGKQLCKRASPLCGECPLGPVCAFLQSQA